MINGRIRRLYMLITTPQWSYPKVVCAHHNPYTNNLILIVHTLYL